LQYFRVAIIAAFAKLNPFAAKMYYVHFRVGTKAFYNFTRESESQAFFPVRA
jgi:hypothetical protein